MKNVETQKEKESDQTHTKRKIHSFHLNRSINTKQMISQTSFSKVIQELVFTIQSRDSSQNITNLDKTLTLFQVISQVDAFQATMRQFLKTPKLPKLIIMSKKSIKSSIKSWQTWKFQAQRFWTPWKTKTLELQTQPKINPLLSLRYN